MTSLDDVIKLLPVGLNPPIIFYSLIMSNYITCVHVQKIIKFVPYLTCMCMVNIIVLIISLRSPCTKTLVLLVL